MRNATDHILLLTATPHKGDPENFSFFHRLLDADVFADVKSIREILPAGIQQVRVVLRAIALVQLSSGQTAPRVARIVHLSPQAVRRIAHRYCHGGLESALYERAGRGAKPLLDTSEKQRVIAMVCSMPPQGQARWTVRLIAEEAVRPKLVPRVETIRVLLSSHELKPWREKNVVRGRSG